MHQAEAQSKHSVNLRAATSTTAKKEPKQDIETLSFEKSFRNRKSAYETLDALPVANRRNSIQTPVSSFSRKTGVFEAFMPKPTSPAQVGTNFLPDPKGTTQPNFNT